MLHDQTAGDDAQPTEHGPTGRPSILPTSSPSTWAGAIVVGSLLGFYMLRRSFRRML